MSPEADKFKPFLQLETQPSGEVSKFINGNSYKRVCLDIGGALLYSSLRNVVYPNTAAVISDPNTSLTWTLIEKAKQGDFPGLLTEIEDHRDYDPYPPEVRERLELEYKSLWDNSGESNLNHIYTLKSGFRDLRRIIPTNSIDLITCYYPHPYFMEPSTLIKATSRLLREGGTFELLTERLSYFQGIVKSVQKDKDFKLEKAGFCDVQMNLSPYDAFFRYDTNYGRRSNSIDEELFGRFHVIAEKHKESIREV